MITRCFGSGDPVYERYHDEEWGVDVVDSPDERELFERVVLEGFQAGLSWATILHRREAFRAAFDGFVPGVVATYDDVKLAELMANPAIIRNHAKITAAVTNARALLAMHERGETLRGLIDRHAPLPTAAAPQSWQDVPTRSPESLALSRAMKQRGFTFVGPTTMYALMQAIGVVNDHLADCHVRLAGPAPQGVA